MYEFEQNFLLWSAELILRLALLGTFQFCAASFAVNVAHLKVSLPLRYIILICGQIVLIWTGSFLFDPRTHILGSTFAAASIAFISPLHALAYLHQTHTELIDELRVAKLRIAIPAAAGKSTHGSRQTENPWTQIRRGLLFMVTTGACRSLLRDSIVVGGILMDLMLLIIVWGAINALLNLTSALLGAFGVGTTRPFARPFFASSQAAFWAGRWNAPVADAIRTGVFIPLLHAGVSRSTAIAICFITSAIAHEFLLLYVGVRESPGDWTLFFVCAGVATLIEKKFFVFKRYQSFRRIFGAFVLLTLFHFLFVPVVIRNGLAIKIVNELSCVEVMFHKVFRNLLAIMSNLQ